MSSIPTSVVPSGLPVTIPAVPSVTLPTIPLGPPQIPTIPTGRIVPSLLPAPAATAQPCGTNVAANRTGLYIRDPGRDSGNANCGRYESAIPANVGPITTVNLPYPFDGFCDAACRNTAGCGSFAIDEATGLSCTLYPNSVDSNLATTNSAPARRFWDNSCFSCATTPSTNCAVNAVPVPLTAACNIGQAQLALSVESLQMLGLVDNGLILGGPAAKSPQLCSAACYSNAACAAIAWMPNVSCQLLQYQLHASDVYPAPPQDSGPYYYGSDCFWPVNTANYTYNTDGVCAVST